MVQQLISELSLELASLPLMRMCPLVRSVLENID